jgi:hypothetical protein
LAIAAVAEIAFSSASGCLRSIGTSIFLNKRTSHGCVHQDVVIEVNRNGAVAFQIFL